MAGYGSGNADSAGTPWAGRSLTAQPFAGDDGAADPALVAALQAWAAGGSLVDVVAAWADSRVLVPLVAEGPDQAADMVLVTLTAADGRRALPAFASVASLAAWDAAARPVPVEAARAAQAAVVEGCDEVVIDAAGPIACVLPRPAVWAVGQARRWVPPSEDPDVATAVDGISGRFAAVLAHRCEPGAGPADLRVVIGLQPGLDAGQLHELTAGLGAALAADPVIAERVTALQLTPRPYP